MEAQRRISGVFIAVRSPLGVLLRIFGRKVSESLAPRAVEPPVTVGVEQSPHLQVQILPFETGVFPLARPRNLCIRKAGSVLDRLVLQTIDDPLEQLKSNSNTPTARGSSSNAAPPWNSSSKKGKRLAQNQKRGRSRQRNWLRKQPRRWTTRSACPSIRNWIRLARNPEVQAARETVDKSRTGLRAAHGEYIPDIGAFARLTYLNGVPFLAPSFGTFGLQGLQMTWNIFDWGKRKGVVGQREALLTQAEENLRRITDRVSLEVDKAYRKIGAKRTRGLRGLRGSGPARGRANGCKVTNSRLALFPKLRTR